MKKTVKIGVISGGIILFISLLLWVGGIVLRMKIERELADLQLGEFHLTTEQVSVNLFHKSLTLNGIKIKTEERDPSLSPDSLLASTVQFLDGRIDRVVVSGISLKQLRNKTLALSSLLIEGPRGTMVTSTHKADSNIASNTINKNRPKFKIDRLMLTDGAVDWRQITADDTLKCLINGMQADISEFKLDSARQISFGNTTKIDIAKILYSIAHKSYNLSFSSVNYNNLTCEFFIDSIAVIPMYSKWDFPRESFQKSDYMAVGLRGFSVHGLKIDSLLNKGAILADSVHVASGNFTSTKDRNADVPVRVKPMLHTVIQRLSFPIDIQKVTIDSLDAAYEETAPNRTTAGRVTFEGTRATILGMTNVVKHKEQYIEVYAASKLMGTGALDAVISLPVDPANDRFEVTATLGTTSMSTLNGMILPLTGMEIAAGTIDRMDFTMTGDSRTASAATTLRYRGLKLGMLKLKNGRWQERGELSDIVNRLAIKTDNPDGQGLRSARVVVTRDPHRSAFNYLWKGVSAGAMETAKTGLAKKWVKKQGR